MNVPAGECLASVESCKQRLHFAPDSPFFTPHKLNTSVKFKTRNVNKRQSLFCFSFRLLCVYRFTDRVSGTADPINWETGMSCAINVQSLKNTKLDRKLKFHRNVGSSAAVTYIAVAGSGAAPSRSLSRCEHNSLGCACRVKAGFMCAKYYTQCSSRYDVFPVHLHAVPGVSSYKMYGIRLPCN